MHFKYALTRALLLFGLLLLITSVGTYGLDCPMVHCETPYTQAPLGSPCGCVLPMKVAIELDMVLAALLPILSVLAETIADGTLLLKNQVILSGASVANADESKSIAEFNLLPLGQTFDNLTAFFLFQRFCDHNLPIPTSIFGHYTVVYVRYPGLPPPYPYIESNGSTTGGLPALPTEKPLGVDIAKKDHRTSSNIHGHPIIIILLLTIGVAVISVTLFVLFLQFNSQVLTVPAAAPTCAFKVLGVSTVSSDVESSVSGSFTSSMAMYKLSARTFSLCELERATNSFSTSNLVGEGGFGRVFSGVLDDGSKVAVKLFTRIDQQSNKEFNAEINMLSRLHHRNVVKLIGVCIEEHRHCLVYELIPNGSVESHLHGVDKLVSPLNWDARMKIALGAARGLAYLHEDANPHVIHRDFKGSNILLEDDFSPKIADFGLAKSATDDENVQLSTRVMGTFGYVAPEYAMTGYLLVKSDVYSYGVVLLELLSGRKPIDLSRSPGQESIVSWARPLLSSKEGLKMLADPALEGAFSFDDFTKVATIASLCVQPEVSHRPFMGEVVQALKLVWNDLGGMCSITVSPEDSGGRADDPWAETQTFHNADSTSFMSVDYDSGIIQTTTEHVCSQLFQPGDFDRYLPDSFRRHSISDPSKPSGSKSLWNIQRGAVCRSVSDSGLKHLIVVDCNTGAVEKTVMEDQMQQSARRHASNFADFLGQLPTCSRRHSISDFSSVRGRNSPGNIQKAALYGSTSDPGFKCM